jgi:DNA-binding transcriptional MerR regulator
VYRYYDVAQLTQLHRLLALRDLGFSLEQIRDLLHDTRCAHPAATSRRT